MSFILQVCAKTPGICCVFFRSSWYMHILYIHTYLTREQEEHLNKTTEIINNNNNNVVYVWNRRLKYRFVHFSSYFLFLLWKIVLSILEKAFLSAAWFVNYVFSSLFFLFFQLLHQELVSLVCLIPIFDDNIL